MNNICIKWSNLLEALQGQAMYNGMSDETNFAAADELVPVFDFTDFSGEADMNR